MTSYEFGDVVLVPFPFSDQTTHKKRPAVVISSAAYARERPDLLVPAITSQVRPTPGIGEAPITHWQDAGLVKPGVLKPVLTTIEKRLVVRKLGQLTPAGRQNLRRVLDVILGQ
ncbi:MAG: type II toxin-antitoxin system PemK/MazF family toxin [Deferrisomatales bacterium]|nr:type II toxin-antitoxin system PemK/MazF family toxin [Deferrisomatales bacterium]